MQVSLKQLRYFVAIAECGKVAEAAKKLFVSQPALSAALAQLEDTWQTQLFIRHKAQGVSLTSSGESLLSHSRQLLQQANTLNDYARGLSQQVSGEIHIGCFSTLGPIFIPQLLQLTQTHYPDIQIRVVEDDLANLEELVLKGQLEMALGYDIDHDARIAIEPLASSPPYVLLPDGHPLAEQDSLTLSQLTNEPMVLLDLPHSKAYFLAQFERANCKPKIAYRSKSFEMVRSMVAAGLGFSLLNQRPRCNQAYNGLDIRSVALADGEAEPLQIVITRHIGLKPSVRAETVTGLLKQILGAG